MAAGAARLTSFTLVNDDVRIDASLDTPGFAYPGLCMRRLTLDAILLEAARAAGAQIRTGCPVRGLLLTGGRVSGVSTDDGLIAADFVIGADGRHSMVAQSVGAKEYLVTPPGRRPVWAYFRGVGDREGRLRIGRRDDLAFLASPTDGGLYMAGIAIGGDQRKCFDRDREANFAMGLSRWPELADLLAGARREGPLRVISEWHGYFRRSAGNGWALVGDAGHFKDFTPAQGISDAFRQAKHLAAMLLSERPRSWDAAAQAWWRWRDRDARAMYWLAADMGVAGCPTPLITRLLRDIAADHIATEQLLRVLNHELPPARLFTMKRLANAAVGSVRDQPEHLRSTVREIASAVANETYRAASKVSSAARIRHLPTVV